MNPRSNRFRELGFHPDETPAARTRNHVSEALGLFHTVQDFSGYVNRIRRVLTKKHLHAQYS